MTTKIQHNCDKKIWYSQSKNWMNMNFDRSRFFHIHNKKKVFSILTENLICLLVRSMGLEPIWTYVHYPLKVARLPFRHDRIWSCLWCSGTELNRRHGDFQSPALPTELPERIWRPRSDLNRRSSPWQGDMLNRYTTRPFPLPYSRPECLEQKELYHVSHTLASTFFSFFHFFGEKKHFASR